MPATDPHDPRLGRWLAHARAATDGTRVALVGFPSDEGVRRNGGRVGAAAGPAAIRAALHRMTPDARNAPAFVALLERTADVGDVAVTGDLEADQAALGAVVGDLLRRGVVPIVLGGGHETLYGHVLCHVDAGTRGLHLVNWDAHADVRPLLEGEDGRPLGHSGSPFRQAIEHPSGLVASYTLAGALPWRVAEAHAAYVARHGRIVWREDLNAATAERIARDTPGPALASFDLDALDAGAMPGVSAPGVGGLDVPTWLRAARACGASPAFRSFDVVELNPAFDPDGRSATLAALTVWHLLAGLAERPA